MKISVILPSLNPDEKLLATVKGLKEEGFTDIILVNDGSDEKHTAPFEEAERLYGVTVLTHEVNKGKGRALKTAFEYCIKNRPDIDGVVTADGDGQHIPTDVSACCKKMSETGKVILGCRDFKNSAVPGRSRFGNSMTKFVFRFACGVRISDTQTGLRAIPYKYLEFMVKIKGERYEYETQMLLEMQKYGIGYAEETITTIYINENESSHFHPFRDSVKIYMVILKYIANSLLSFLIDIGLFTLLEFVIGDTMDKSLKIFVSTFGARVVSSIFNYLVSRKVVFESKSSVGRSVLKYYILCACQTGISYGLVYLFSYLFGAENVLTSVIKLIVDVTLFIISFQIQRRWVFAEKKQYTEEQ